MAYNTPKIEVIEESIGLESSGSIPDTTLKHTYDTIFAGAGAGAAAESKYPISGNVNISGEENFREMIDGQIREWRDKEVKSADFISYDGSKLHYYFELPKESKATIVIVHGFCEFWGKYHEMAWYFRQAGYGFFFMEQRGHGYSHRDVESLDLVHIDNYSQYVEDLNQFIKQVVIPENGDRHLYLFAHSMGGAVGTLFLEQYPRYFEKAVLSSPMLDIKTGNIPKSIISVYAAYLKMARKMKELSVNQNHFDGRPNFENSSCLSRVRYNYQFEQRLKNENYQTNGATFGWGSASLAANRKLLRNAKRVQIPVLMFIAGMDHLVNSRGQLIFAEKSANTRVVVYKEAKHEIFNSLKPILTDYYGRIFDFLGMG